MKVGLSYVSGSDKRPHLVKIFETYFWTLLDSYNIGEHDFVESTPMVYNVHKIWTVSWIPLHYNLRMTQILFISLQSVYS